MNFPTPADLAREMQDAYRNAPPETSRQHFARLVRMGLIDTQGRITKKFGGEAELEIEKADELLAEEQNGKAKPPAKPAS
ncbi:MAG TPA: hypothetical protein VE988_22205 [Gemmataceae bacterium]|nr:hypothetical protein [Gemmataceae bacterium]